MHQTSMEREALVQDYEAVVQRQTLLLSRQQATIDSLEEEVAAQQHRAEVATKQLQTRLDTLQQQSSATTLQDATHEIHLLKQELETALKEETSQAESRRQALEVQRLHQALLSSKGGSTPLKESEEYMKAVEALEEETTRLRTQAAELEEEKVVTLRENHQLKKEVTSLGSRVEEEQRVTQTLRSLTEEKEANARELSDSFNSLNKKFLEQGEDLHILLAQMQSLKTNRDHLAKVLLIVKEKLKEAQSRVTQSVRIAEDSLVEKDAALLREKHALDEVQRLEGTVAGLTEEAGRRAQAEVTKVKDDYNTNIKKLSQEVVRLEVALTEKKMECEKIQRELKKTLEEIDWLQEEAAQRREHHRQDTLNLHQRITSLEAQVMALKDEKSNMSTLGLQNIKEVEQQREDLLGRISELEERLRAARTECVGARLESEEAKRSLTKVTNHLERLQEESVRDHNFLKTQLRIKIEELEVVTSCVEGRLESSETHHREALTQSQLSTAVMRDNCSRLQTQLREQKRQYCSRISEVTQRLQEAEEQQQQTALALHKANTSLAVSESVVAQYKARLAEAEERLLIAERRFLKLHHHSSDHQQDAFRTS